MKIDILTNDGSPLGVTLQSLHGEDGRIGVGGAESALLTMCEAWHKEGYEVTLYNNPDTDGSPFQQKRIDEFCPEDNRDYLIVFRSPNPRIYDAKGKKIWWSCDQHTIGNFAEFARSVDKIVTISRFHAKYFQDVYDIRGTVTIDLPVRTWEYKEKVEKIPKRCIFTSVPDRGVMNLHAAWPLIVQEVPDASLVITSDHRLWNRNFGIEVLLPWKLRYSHVQNVTYLGAVTRKQLVEEQLKADLYTYPCTYDELFCIACAEAQVAGAFPITSTQGALNSTNMGMVISGNPNDPKWIEVFVSKIVEFLKDSVKLKERQARIQDLALKRFNINRIMEQWEEFVFE